MTGWLHIGPMVMNKSYWNEFSDKRHHLALKVNTYLVRKINDDNWIINDRIDDPNIECCFLVEFYDIHGRSILFRILYNGEKWIQVRCNNTTFEEYKSSLRLSTGDKIIIDDSIKLFLQGL